MRRGVVGHAQAHIVSEGLVQLFNVGIVRASPRLVLVGRDHVEQIVVVIHVIQRGLQGNRRICRRVGRERAIVRILYAQRRVGQLVFAQRELKSARVE